MGIAINSKSDKSGCDSEDRVSQLSDEILAHILSFLSLKEALVTSVLSRRWTDLWAFATRLHFDNHNLSLFYQIKERDSSKWKSRAVENRERFIKGVNHVLKLHKSPTIEEFRIYMDLGENFKSDIDEWLKFALARRVETLELYLIWSDIDPAYYYKTAYSLKLPTSSSDQAGGTFKSLKSLCLNCVDVSGQVVENILANCPVLERLSVHATKELKSLKVTGPSLVLKYLGITRCYDINSIEICNVMNLVSFEYSGPNTNLHLENVPRLMELCISGGVANFMSDFFPKLSCCFSQLETLALGVPPYMEFGVHAPPELPNLRKFVLNGTLYDDICLLGYTSLIKASPFLQKFVYRAKWFYRSVDKYTRRTLREPVKCRHERLEEVELAGYCGRKSDLELASYFLQNAVSLKKIIVRPYDQNYFRYEDQPTPSKVTEKEKGARRREAKEQLEGKIPPGVELIIL